jgi:hypothetical protein
MIPLFLSLLQVYRQYSRWRTGNQIEKTMNDDLSDTIKADLAAF